VQQGLFSVSNAPNGFGFILPDSGRQRVDRLRHILIGEKARLSILNEGASQFLRRERKTAQAIIGKI